MDTQRPIFKKKKLVIAVGMAMIGGVMSGCSSDSDSVAAAVYNILANGGNGGNSGSANGGDAGEIYLESIGPTGGVQVRKNGKANANFTTPGFDKTADLGDNPLAITTDTTLDTTVDIVADGAGGLAVDELYQGTDKVLRSSAAGGVAVYSTDPVAAAGTIYMVTSADYGVYLSSGSTTPDMAYTGLSVAEGATLTLGNNNGCSSRVSFKNDIENAGTITMTKVSNACEIYIYTDKYLASGNIVNVGTEAYPDAGSVYVYALSAAVNSGMIDASGYDDATGAGGTGDYIRLSSDGYTVNSGTLDASGGDGMGAGGDARNVRISGAYTENTGFIDLTGGDNTTDGVTPGNGGDGGWFSLYSTYVTNNTGDIDASGGDGSVGGDSNNNSYLYNNYVGEVKNSGNINLSGGVGHTSSGGDGGDITMYSRGGELRNSGDISVAGGDSLSTTSSGGDGGDIEFYTDGGESGEALGNIEVSGNLDISGGDALLAGTGSGGDAGYLDLNIDGAEGFDDYTYNFSNQRVALLGYVSIEANGGDGDDGGEGAGVGCCDDGIMMRTEALYVPSTQKYSVGSVLNEVAINARGGNSVADVADGGEGGAGGLIELYSSIDPSISSGNSRATNSGDIDVNGGVSIGTVGDGGEGGFLYMESYHGSTNSGDLAANGAVTDDTYGGDAGGMYMISVVGAANNSGVVTASGADGMQYGGDGGFVFLAGKTASNSAAITLDGANADNPYTGAGTSYGGDGGELSVVGAGLTGASSNSGTVSILPGTGEVNGDEGCIRVGVTFEGDCN